MKRSGWTLRRDGETELAGPFVTRREALEASGICTGIASRVQWGEGAYTYTSNEGSVVHIERGSV